MKFIKIIPLILIAFFAVNVIKINASDITEGLLGSATINGVIELLGSATINDIIYSCQE